MPPDVEMPKPPSGMGREAMDWLCSIGLSPVTPAVRSSDYELLLSNPFFYYLTRKLGLCDRLKWSPAACRGTWIHKAAELDPFSIPLSDPAFTTGYNQSVKDRLTELTLVCNESGIVGDVRAGILERESRTADTALGRYLASSSIEIPNYGYFRTWMSSFTVLARELEVSVPCFPGSTLMATAKLDALVLDQHRKLRIIDYKTSEMDLIDRLSTCPSEFQTNHYLSVTRTALQSGILRSFIPSLPDDVSIGGMYHVAFLQPSIVFGEKDRPFTDNPHVLQSGPRKGQTEIRRTYHGEPHFPLYVARVRRWLLGEGEYADLKPDRLASPAINISHTPIDNLDSWRGEEYAAQLEFVAEFASRTPYPRNFPKSINSLRQYGDLSDWAPLALLPVADWPAVFRKLGLIVQHRDVF